MTTLRTYTNQELLDHLLNMSGSGTSWLVDQDLITVVAGRLKELVEYKDLNETADTYEALREALSDAEHLQSGVNKALVMSPGEAPYFVLGACSPEELRKRVYELSAPAFASVIAWRQDFITGREVELALSLRPALARYSWTVLGAVKSFDILGADDAPPEPAAPVRRMRMRKPEDTTTPQTTPRVRVRRPA